MSFEEKIKKFAESIPEKIKDIENEAETETALIEQFIRILGYNPANLKEVKKQYSIIIKIGTTKPTSKKIDVVILNNNREPEIIIESKTANNKLIKNHQKQLESYYNNTPNCRLGILTNGTIYKFFTDTGKLMDKEPFIEIDLTKLIDEDISELEMFTKGKYNSKNIVSYAKEKQINTKIKKLLEKEPEHPSDDFVRIIAKKVDKGVITKNKIKKFRRVIKNNLKIISDEKLKEMIREPAISSANFRFKGFTKKEEEEFKKKYKALPEKFKDNKLIRNNTIVNLAKVEELPENSLYGKNDRDFKLVDNILTSYFIKTNDYIENFVKSGIFKDNDDNIKKKTKRRFIKYLNSKELDMEEKKLLDEIFSE